MAEITGEGIVVLLVLVGMFTALFFEVLAPEMIVFTCLMIVWNTGIISTSQALSGFSNEGMITVGALFIVVKGVERSGIVDRVARQVFGQKTSKMAGLFRLQVLTFALSGFFNNTPLVALLMPITRDWARSRGFAPSQFLIPLSFSSIVGGLTTIIGTSTNLVVQGLLQDEDQEQFGFFEPAQLGVVLGVLLIAYNCTIGQRLLPSNRGGMFRLVRDRASELITEIGISESCPLIGLPVEQFLETIGINSSALLKIRRPCQIGSPNACSKPATAMAKDKTEVFDEEKMENPSMSTKSAPADASKFHSPPPFDLEEGAGIDPESPGPGMAIDRDSDEPEPHTAESVDGTWQISDYVMNFMNRPNGMTPMQQTQTESVSELHPSVSMLRMMHKAASADEGNPGGPEVRAVDLNYAIRNKHLWGRSSSARMAREERSEFEHENHSLISNPATGDERLQSAEDSPDTQLRRRSSGRRGSGPIDYRRKYLEATAVPALPASSTPAKDTTLRKRKTANLNGHAVAAPAEDALTEDKLVKYLKPKESLETGSTYSRTSKASKSKKGEVNAPPPMYIDILPVPKGEVIQGGDVVFLSVGAHALAHFRQAVPHKGLKLLDVDVLDMTGFGTEVAELLLSDSNPFLGEELQKIRDDFQTRYSCSIIAVRQKGGDPGAVSQAADVHTRDLKLSAGDTVLVNAFEEALDTLEREFQKDFFLITRVGSIPLPRTYYDYAPCVFFVAMLLVVLLADIPISRASLVTVAVLVIGGWISSKEALNYVDFKLLALIGSALGFSNSIRESGLAGVVSSLISNSGLGALGSLFLLYFFTVAMTELVTNNAAAALAVPIAVQLSKDLELSHFPFAAAVLFGASTAFATPVGYQTNTMVWNPGGYKFSDFMKVGFPIDLMFMVVSCLLIPVIWPF